MADIFVKKSKTAPPEEMIEDELELRIKEINEDLNKVLSEINDVDLADMLERGNFDKNIVNRKYNITPEELKDKLELLKYLVNISCSFPYTLDPFRLQKVDIPDIAIRAEAEWENDSYYTTKGTLTFINDDKKRNIGYDRDSWFKKKLEDWLSDHPNYESLPVSSWIGEGEDSAFKTQTTPVYHALPEHKLKHPGKSSCISWVNPTYAFRSKSQGTLLQYFSDLSQEKRDAISVNISSEQQLRLMSLGGFIQLFNHPDHEERLFIAYKYVLDKGGDDDNSMHFGQWIELYDEDLTRGDIQWCEITLKYMLDCGALRFAFIGPDPHLTGERFKSRAGGFAYKFNKGIHKFFPIQNEPKPLIRLCNELRKKYSWNEDMSKMFSYCSDLTTVMRQIIEGKSSEQIKEYTEQLDQEVWDEVINCKICFECPKSYIFLPCKHFDCCNLCIGKMDNPNICPFCKTPTHGFLKTTYRKTSHFDTPPIPKTITGLTKLWSRLTKEDKSFIITNATRYSLDNEFSRDILSILQKPKPSKEIENYIECQPAPVMYKTSSRSSSFSSDLLETPQAKLDFVFKGLLDACRKFPFSLPSFDLKSFYLSELESSEYIRIIGQRYSLAPSMRNDKMNNLKKCVKTTEYDRYLSGRYTTFHEITISEGEQQSIRIPKDATHFAFAYPIELSLRVNINYNILLPMEIFGLYGGFMYSKKNEDGTYRLLSINYLNPNNDPNNGLKFEEVKDASKILDIREQELALVTIKELKEGGAHRFCWVHPSKNSRHYPHGCFVYKVDGFKSLKAFRVKTNDVCSPDSLNALLEEYKASPTFDSKDIFQTADIIYKSEENKRVWITKQLRTQLEVSYRSCLGCRAPRSVVFVHKELAHFSSCSICAESNICLECNQPCEEKYDNVIIP